MTGDMFYFFFSSRRRHTRWNCDWSSDVCSSDLQSHERLGIVRRVQRDEAHAFPHPGEHALDDGVADLAMGSVPPPDQNVGFVEHAPSQPVLRLLQSGGTDFERPIFSNAFGDRRVHAARINSTD